MVELVALFRYVCAFLTAGVGLGLHNTGTHDASSTGLQYTWKLLQKELESSCWCIGKETPVCLDSVIRVW